MEVQPLLPSLTAEDKKKKGKRWKKRFLFFFRFTF